MLTSVYDGTEQSAQVRVGLWGEAQNSLSHMEREGQGEKRETERQETEGAGDLGKQLREMRFGHGSDESERVRGWGQGDSWGSKAVWGLDLLSGCGQEEEGPGNELSRMEEGSRQKTRTKKPVKTHGRDVEWLLLARQGVWKASATIRLSHTPLLSCSQPDLQDHLRPQA